MAHLGPILGHGASKLLYLNDLVWAKVWQENAAIVTRYDKQQILKNKALKRPGSGAASCVEKSEAQRAETGSEGPDLQIEVT